MGRKRSQGPVTDAEGMGQVGDVLRSTFVVPDIGESDDKMTRLMLHLSHVPKAQPPKNAPNPDPKVSKRKSWLRRKRSS